MAEKQANRLLSRKEVETVYGLSARLLEIMATKGEGPTIVRFGRMVRYRVEDIEAWILDHRVAPGGDRP